MPVAPCRSGNPKQARMLKIQNSKQDPAGAGVSVIRALGFGFVSDFGFRISDLVAQYR
jgi:hypothetical protein